MTSFHCPLAPATGTGRGGNAGPRTSCQPSSDGPRTKIGEGGRLLEPGEEEEAERCNGGSGGGRPRFHTTGAASGAAAAAAAAAMDRLFATVGASVADWEWCESASGRPVVMTAIPLLLLLLLLAFLLLLLLLSLLLPLCSSTACP